MHDPLTNFDWNSLYELYDNLCHGFNPNHELLGHYNPLPQKDRDLYYQIIKSFSEDKAQGRISFQTYGAMLYWKLYSQPAAVANILNRISDRQESIMNKLEVLSRELPGAINQDINEIVQLIQRNELAIFGMGAETTLPVRSTFLHFLYPETVPVFDQMVLRAVSGCGYQYAEGDNQRIEILKKYIPHNWELAERYSMFRGNRPESMVRLIDMALWIMRSERH